MLVINTNNAALKTILLLIEYNGKCHTKTQTNFLICILKCLLLLCSIAMAFVSNSSLSEDKNSSETDLNIINTEDEMCTETANWTPAKWKKLQHMTEFHEEYQKDIQ